MKKLPVYVRILLSTGLLMATLPMLLKDYFAMPGYLRVIMAGFGLSLEITALVLIRRIRKTGLGCYVEK